MDMTEICVLVAVVEFIFCEIKQETGRGGNISTVGIPNLGGLLAKTFVRIDGDNYGWEASVFQVVMGNTQSWVK